MRFPEDTNSAGVGGCEVEQTFEQSGFAGAVHTSQAEQLTCANLQVKPSELKGRRFGRVIESSAETGGLSVDVVDLENIVGPHHRHPTGEICMVMPVTEGARFDGNARGWCVFEPGSDHRPTVTDGEALVLYMLPDGKIEFTEQ